MLGFFNSKFIRLTEEIVITMVSIIYIEENFEKMLSLVSI